MQVIAQVLMQDAEDAAALACATKVMLPWLLSTPGTPSPADKVQDRQALDRSL